MIEGKLHVEICTDSGIQDIPITFGGAGAVFHFTSGCLVLKSAKRKLIGAETLKEFPQPIFLDFHKMEMEAGYSGESNFQPIPARFSAAGIEGIFRIRWKDYKFALDPGLDEGVLLTAQKSMRFLSGHSYRQINGRFYPGIGIGINGRDYGPGITIRKSGSNLIGNKFLSGFNWLIDFGRKKLSAVKNERVLDFAMATSPNAR